MTLNKDFLGWKKTSISILKAKGKNKNGLQSLKKKSLLKKLWKVYKKSNQYKELSLDQQNRDYKSIDEVVTRIIQKEFKKFKFEGDSEDRSSLICLR